MFSYLSEILIYGLLAANVIAYATVEADMAFQFSASPDAPHTGETVDLALTYKSMPLRRLPEQLAKTLLCLRLKR